MNEYNNPVITESSLPENLKPLSPWKYFLWMLLYSVPLIGLIFLIINSFTDKNVNLRNFTRSYWIGLLIAIVISVVLIATGIAFGLSSGAFEEIISEIQSVY